jgi:ribose transport system ATP-binding protein
VKRGLAFLPAERNVEGVVGGLTAARNLTLAHPPVGMKGAFLNPAARSRIANDWFEKLDVRPRKPSLALESFSGGNQQKVALAKWLVGRPKVLILDHPLRGLDPGACDTVKSTIREACQSGAGVLLIADTLEEALELGDEIIVMRDGEVTGCFDMHKDSPTTLDLIEKMV